MADAVTPYVFHCTPCGKAHAGECPTKLVRLEPRNVCVDSLWVQESWSHGAWERIETPVWKVVQAFEKFVDIESVDFLNGGYGGVVFQAALEAFSVEGWQPPIMNSRKWRMVPYADLTSLTGSVTVGP